MTIKYALRLIWMSLCICVIWGCASAPSTNLAPDLYPAALLAEPIKMRAGFIHTSQAFTVTGPEQVWEVNIGFMRRDDKINVKRFFCLVDSRKSPLREFNNCSNDEPSIHVKWVLVRLDGTEVGGFVYDALHQKANGQSSKKALQIGLAGC
jgi:hypothetical protein